MDTTLLVIIVIAAVALVAIAAIGWFVAQKKRSDELRSGFGSEYDRTVDEYGSKGKAEADLRERQKRVSKFDIRPLDPNERERYAKSWAATQARFVDSPAEAVGEADGLVNEVMRARGYPMSDFDQQAADISVDHPQVVENYRSARAIAERNEAGEASTEDLRQAMVHYRELFNDLLEGDAEVMEEQRETVRR
ncbi:MAG TPA: hypothetical protein VFO84_03575 [Dehalococcoidia bacterium]|nr:hypothetical protein [Dehalococcoidia bacterium]